MATTFDQHGIVVRSDDSSCKAISTVKANSVAACGPVDLNLAGIGGEALRRVFGGDTALDGESF